MRVVTQSKYVSLVSRFIADEQTRYYLNGIYFEKHPVKGVVMTATNGHILGSVYDEDALFESKDDKGFILPITKGMKRAMKDSKNAMFSHHKNISSLVHTDRVNFKACEKLSADHIYMEWNSNIDATFPDWRRAIPKGDFKPCMFFSYNPKYFNVFEYANGNGVANGVKIFQTDETSPALVKIGDMPEFFGCIMPMRTTINDKNLMPEWTKQ